MNIALSHISALEAYYHDLAGLNSRLGGPGGLSKSLLSDPFSPSVSREESSFLEEIGLTLPVHSLASPQHRGRRDTSIHAHSYCSNSPCCQVFPVRSGLLVSAPEFLLLQMAGELNFAETVALGFELCGRYTRDPHHAGETRYDRNPLTSTTQLKHYCALASGQHHVKLIRDSLPYIRDNSRSPMETYLAMRLGFPCLRGGFGLGMPELNARIELDDTAKYLSRKSYLECDLFYPEAKLAIEYESTAFHGNVSAAKNREDSARRAALEHLGIKVLTVTDSQALNEEQLRILAIDIAAVLNKRIRPTCKNYPEKQHLLRIALLGNGRGRR